MTKQVTLHHYLHEEYDLNKLDVFAVVVSFNGGQKTSESISALLGNVGHIHVVDNASDAKSVEILDSIICEGNISLTKLSQNKGIGYALNLGVKLAQRRGYKWILTMDQDSVIGSDMIDQYFMAIEKNPRMVCLSPNIKMNGFRTGEGDEVVDYAITSGNLVRVKVFDVIGAYDEEMFIDGIDFDFSLRLRGAGYKLHKIGNAHMNHELGEPKNISKFFSVFYTRHSPLRRYYMFRNSLYRSEKYLIKFPAFIIKLTISQILLLLLIPFFDKKPFRSILYIHRGIVDYFLRKTGPYNEKR